MTIYNMDAFIAGVWDWAILDGCFGDTRIRPTDIDGLTERKGKFLLLEAKQSGVKIPMGQQLTFNALRNTGLFTIIIMWGEQNKPEAIEILYPAPYPVKKQHPAGMAELREIVSRWYGYADKGSSLYLED